MFIPNCSSSATVNVKAEKSFESSLLARQPSAKARFIEASEMKAEYDLSKLKARKIQINWPKLV